MRILLIHFIVLLYGVWSPIIAQRPAPPVTEKHAKRFLLVSNISFVNSKNPVSTIGGLFQRTICKGKVNRITKRDSLVAKIDSSLYGILSEGVVHPNIQKELIGKFFSILDSATVSKCNGVWVLYNGRDMFWFEMENDSLGVFTFMSSQEIAAPKNYFHLLASVDVSGEDDYHVLAQFGVMQRKYPISYGIAAQGIFPSKGIVSCPS